MSNFSFSRSIFYPFTELSAIFIKFQIVICNYFTLEESKICCLGRVKRKGSKRPNIISTLCHMEPMSRCNDACNWTILLSDVVIIVLITWLCNSIILTLLMPKKKSFCFVQYRFMNRLHKIQNLILDKQTFLTYETDCVSLAR